MKKYLLLLIVGLLIRLFLATISYHPDIQHFDLAGSVLLRGSILNFYDYSSKETGIYPFNYPPAVYFSIGLFDGIVTSFEDSNFHYNFLFNYPLVLGDLRLNLHLLLLKLPYLIFDYGICLLLFELFEEEKKRKIALLFWIFNPINLYATYLIGQFDIIPVFFTILALYLALNGNRRGASIFLGLGAGFKIFPLLLIPPLAATIKSWKERIIVLLGGLLTYLLILIPFLPSKGFRASALVANQTLKTLYAQIPISGGESILLFPALLILLYLIFFRKGVLLNSLWTSFSVVLLLFFILTHTHPQWFLWLTPFLILDLVEFKFKNFLPILILVISFVFLVFLFEPSLNLGLFSPLNPSSFYVGNIWELFHKSVDINASRSLFQTIFTGAALYLIYSYLKGNDS